MMLRNRDLNVQKNNNGAEATKAHQQLKANVAGAGVGGKPVNVKPGAHLQKRQAPQLVGGGGHRAAGSSNGSLEAAEPRPKRACSQNDKDKENINPHHQNQQNNNLPRRNVNNNENAAVAVVPVSAFSRSLLIDSAKKESAGSNNNNDVAPVANRRVSVVGAPLAGRRRTSALAVRDTNAAAEIAIQQPLKSSSQEKNNNVITTSQKEEKREDEQKMEVAEQLVVEPVVVLDFDKENERDLSAVSQYAQDIFTYYKYREPFFRVSDYISHAKHPDVTTEKRVKLVDWMVELQETFELNHETLYLGVKLVDLFLNHTKVKVVGQQLQLIASAAVFIASKFDERAPPLIDDFIYMAEDSFSRDQLLEMERELLKVVEFDLGAPLSYRFLRRYARVSKLDMGTLTLARYVLETSLMFLNFCRESESLIAAACLLLAVRMKGIGDWGPVLDKYSGYTRAEVEPLMWRLNQMVDDRKKNYPYQDTVFRKYSHEIFFEVAKVKLLREH